MIIRVIKVSLILVKFYFNNNVGNLVINLAVNSKATCDLIFPFVRT